ncbi:Eco57I restriction-modification methylase domain-containing protein [Bernardetia sp. OM2101]|uniref:type IIG restriction enzyme/methyltransferase n=1 Tax=Bernardetia sp. OM2101 TaxID=3344876 RepID=UPI0035CFD50E
MNIITNPSKVLNPSYRKVNIIRNEINQFKGSLLECLEHIKISDEKKEHEENVKKYIADFLQKTFYQDYLINTKNRVDLAIYAGKDAKSNISVLIEAKRPSNTNEFLKVNEINKKALQELLLYYLTERIDLDNNQIKHLIATNGYEWYFFKGEDFYNFFYKNKKLLKEYNEFVSGRKDSAKNELFYTEIAKKYIEEVKYELPFLYINIKDDYENYLPLSNTNDDKLVSLYKIFSPIHLLAQSYGNDSNELNREFYFELLHIIGLEEVKNNGINLIQRKKQKERDKGSLLETTIFILDDREYLKKVEHLQNYGQDREEQLFNVALELCLTWINRILFLKLLEAQLVVYNKSKEYEFLNTDFITRFNDLEDLFFSALAKKPEERNEERIKEKYKRVPYLNSSLFEPSELEESTLRVSSINGVELEIYDKTVLKDNLKTSKGKISLLSYIFRFLDAYDFSGTDQNKVDESNQGKALISSSVLGLIFEKINGYKEGSFYTPAYITMYMAKETLRKTVLQKFNAHYGWEYQSFDSLKENFYDYIRKGDRNIVRKEANQIINSIKICDPAVGSGHFLVSALNELIVIKNELNILVGKNGEYLYLDVKVENDELVILDRDDRFFIYRPKNELNQIVQETLFHEKQTLIESCLFGVDINPNSVKICRLRLWIELLKNAYYIDYKKSEDLQTLPNIDINIKTGNSLVSRFDVNDIEFYNDLKAAPNFKKYLEEYKNWVFLYKNTKDKNAKWELTKNIKNYKTNLKKQHPSLKKLRNELQTLSTNYFTEYKNTQIFDTNTKGYLEKKQKADNKILEANEKISSFETDRIYRNSLEWLFEFPEVLDKEGNFTGFDAIIGNPPYIRQEEIKEQKPHLKNHYQTYTGKSDLLVFFIELGINLLKPQGIFSFIVANKFLRAGFGKPLRDFLQKQQLHEIIDFGDLRVFTEATAYPCIISAAKEEFKKEHEHSFKAVNIDDLDFKNLEEKTTTLGFEMSQQELESTGWNLIDKKTKNLLSKMKSQGQTLEEYVDEKVFRGVVTGLSEAFVIDEQTKNEFISEDVKNKEVIKPLLSGREIQPYVTPKVNNHLLFIPWHFPLQNKPNITGASKEAEQEFESSYPIIYKHLLSYKDKLEKRNKAETGIRYEWYAMQRWASSYIKEFEKPKIMYQVFQVKPCFIYDDQGLYCNNSMWMIPKDDKTLVAILNSKVGWWLISNYCTAIQNGYQLIWDYFGKIPMPNADKNQTKAIEILVNQILKSKKKNPKTDTTDLENKIDILVYKLYELSYEEVLIIDSDFGLSEEEYIK